MTLRCARLYAFCRYVDDLADESSAAQRADMRLERLALQLRQGRAHDPVAQDFLELVADCDMDLAPALELIRGVRSDLGRVRFADQRTLHRYCYRVAGTVGLMMCDVLGVEDPQAYRYAIDLGIAMQLTNIARDVHEDAQQDRRYVPGPLVSQADPAAIAAPDARLQRELRSAVDWLLLEADRYYRSAAIGYRYLPGRARTAIRVAARVYRAIGTELRRQDCASWRGRAYVPGWKKPLLALGQFPAAARDGLRRRDATHTPGLHRHLDGLYGAVSQP